MPTNEERRIVAARLRELAPGSDWPDMVAESCGLNPREMSNSLHEFTGELCDRLADLIEPEPRNCATCPEIDNNDSFIFHLLQAERFENTRAERMCKAIFIGTHRGYEPRLYCSECATELFGKYCPECGAKVVGNVE